MQVNGSTGKNNHHAGRLRSSAPGVSQPNSYNRRSRRGISVAVVSGKGGVGKTNIAVNLATHLSACGRSVTLIDLDVGMANADLLLDVRPPYNLGHVLSGARRLDEVAFQTGSRVQFIAGVSGISSPADMGPFDRGRLTHQIRSLSDRTDVSILDCAAGISTSVIAFATMADVVLVVTTPEPTAVTDAYAIVKVLAGRKTHGKIMLVVNMADGRTQAQGVYRRIAKVTEKFLHFSLADGGYVLQDNHVELAVRGRRPFALSYPRCPASVCIRALAAKLVRFSPARMTDGVLSRFAALFA